jgi:hypothetical protein
MVDYNLMSSVDIYSAFDSKWNVPLQKQVFIFLKTALDMPVTYHGAVMITTHFGTYGTYEGRHIDILIDSMALRWIGTHTGKQGKLLMPKAAPLSYKSLLQAPELKAATSRCLMKTPLHHRLKNVNETMLLNLAPGRNRKYIHIFTLGFATNLSEF